MKNLFKFLAFYLLSMLFVSDANADEWAKQDCLEYEQMIG